MSNSLLSLYVTTTCRTILHCHHLGTETPRVRKIGNVTAELAQSQRGLGERGGEGSARHYTSSNDRVAEWKKKEKKRREEENRLTSVDSPFNKSQCRVCRTRWDCLHSVSAETLSFRVFSGFFQWTESYFQAPALSSPTFSSVEEHSVTVNLSAVSKFFITFCRVINIKK